MRMESRVGERATGLLYPLVILDVGELSVSSGGEGVRSDEGGRPWEGLSPGWKGLWRASEEAETKGVGVEKRISVQKDKIERKKEKRTK